VKSRLRAPATNIPHERLEAVASANKGQITVQRAVVRSVERRVRVTELHRVIEIHRRNSIANLL
jgi:hypothetical protein